MSVLYINLFRRNINLKIHSVYVKNLKKYLKNIRNKCEWKKIIKQH